MISRSDDEDAEETAMREVAVAFNACSIGLEATVSEVAAFADEVAEPQSRSNGAEEIETTSQTVSDRYRRSPRRYQTARRPRGRSAEMNELSATIEEVAASATVARRPGKPSTVAKRAGNRRVSH